MDPPEDLIDSRGPSSIPSITSEESFPNVPIECIPTARVPVKGPNPVIGKRTNAKINSGNALITFNICLVTLLKVFNEKLFAAKNAIGKLKNGGLFTIEVTTAARPKDFEASLSVVGEKGLIEIGMLGH